MKVDINKFETAIGVSKSFLVQAGVTLDSSKHCMYFKKNGYVLAPCGINQEDVNMILKGKAKIAHKAIANAVYMKAASTALENLIDGKQLFMEGEELDIDVPHVDAYSNPDKDTAHPVIGMLGEHIKEKALDEAILSVDYSADNYDEIEAEAEANAPDTEDTMTTVKLSDATEVFQPTQGTSNGSVYTCIAVGPKFNVSCRITGLKISIRAEGDLSGCEKAISDAGMERKGDSYASVHMNLDSEVFVPKVLGSVISTLATKGQFTAITLDLSKI